MYYRSSLTWAHCLAVLSQAAKHSVRGLLSSQRSRPILSGWSHCVRVASGGDAHSLGCVGSWGQKVDTLHHLYSHETRAGSETRMVGTESASESKQGGARKHVVVAEPLDPSCSNQVTACSSIASSCGGGDTLVGRGILALQHLCHSASQDRGQQRGIRGTQLPMQPRKPIVVPRHDPGSSVPHGGSTRCPRSLSRTHRLAATRMHACTGDPQRAGVPRSCKAVIY